MVWDIWMFIALVLTVFAIVMLIAGVFAAFFGSGKSRTYGGIIAATGLIALAFTIYVCAEDIGPFDTVTWDLFRDAIIYTIAILVGALAAVGIFLASILKS